MSVLKPKREERGENKPNRAAVFGVSSLCLRPSDSPSASQTTDNEFKVVSVTNKPASLFVATYSIFIARPPWKVLAVF